MKDLTWKKVESLAKKGKLEIRELWYLNHKGKRYRRSYFLDLTDPVKVLHPISKKKYIMDISFYVLLGAVDKRTKIK